MLKVLLVDDHPYIRMATKEVLAKAYGRVTVGEARNAREALEQLGKGKWDLVILDINMPGRSGLDILRDVKTMHPGLPVLILSAYPEEQVAVRAYKAGAAGFLSKESSPEEMVQAIRKVLAGGKYVTADLAERLAFTMEKNYSAMPHEKLSDREFQILCLMASGKTSTEIATLLSLSIKTVSTYRARLLEKMNMKTNAELVRYAIKNHLVE